MKKPPRNQIIRSRTELDRHAFFAAAAKHGPVDIKAAETISVTVQAQLEASYREVTERFLHGRSRVTEIQLHLTPRTSGQLGVELARCANLTELLVPAAWAKRLRAFVIADPAFDIRPSIPAPGFLAEYLSHSVLLELDAPPNSRPIPPAPHFDLAVRVNGQGISRWLHDICLDIAVFHSLPGMRQAVAATVQLDLPAGGQTISRLKCEFLLLSGLARRPAAHSPYDHRYASFAERARDANGVLDYAVYKKLWEQFLTFVQHGWVAKGKSAAEVETALFQAIVELLGCRGHLKVRDLRAQFAAHFTSVQQGKAPVQWFTLAVLVKMPARRGRDQVLRSVFGNRLRLWRSRLLPFAPTHPQLLKSSAVAMVLFPIANLSTKE